MSADVTSYRDLILIKLGGSLITDKTRPSSPRTEVMQRLAGQMARLDRSAGPSLIVGHGSGSFGHPTAKAHGIHRGVDDPEQHLGVGLTQRSAASLHALVLQSLLDAEVPAFSLAPSSFSVAAGGKTDVLWPEPLLLALELGLVPVVYGDVVLDRDWGASICSTEALFMALVPALASRGRFVRSVVWLGETEGVLDADGNVIPEIDCDDLSTLAAQIEGASGVDVTGGMRLRLQSAEALARLGVSSWIGSGLEDEALLRGVSGEVVGGTRILPGK